MYTSLHKPADILAQFKDGRSLYLLTDHRPFAEVESDIDLSVAFALIRTINAVRFAQTRGGYYRVAYAAQERPPERMVQAIVSAGGALEVNHVEQPFMGALADPFALFDGAMRGLGFAIAERNGKPLTTDGLRELEAVYIEWAPDLAADEVAYWSAVVTLAAFAGEVLRAAKGGAWARAEHLNLDIPIVYVCGPQTLLLLTKVMKYFGSPATDSVAFSVSQGIWTAEHMPPEGVGVLRI